MQKGLARRRQARGEGRQWLWVNGLTAGPEGRSAAGGGSMGLRGGPVCCA